MPFAPENPLEEVLCRARSDPAARPHFYAMLMQSPLYVLGEVRDHTAIDQVLPSLSARQFELLRLSVKGRHYHPVFTARSRIEALAKGPQPYFAVQGRALLEQTRGAAFLLNFGSEVGKELLPPEIDRLFDPRVTPPPALPEIVISLPDPFPGKLTGALGMLFLNRSQIVSAHLVQSFNTASNDPPHYLIGLVAHGDIRRIVAEIGEVSAVVKNRHPIDVAILDPADTSHDLTMRLLNLPPFFARPIKPH